MRPHTVQRGHTPARNILAYDLETVPSSTPPDNSFPPWPTHRIVAVGLARAVEQGGQWQIALDAVVADAGADGEAALVRRTNEELAGAEVVASYNGRAFDAVVARMAGLRSRMLSTPALAAHAGAHRYAREHADLAELFCGHGAARRVTMAAVCAELGIPVKTTACGGDVAALWAAGERDAIRRYVQEDAVVTLILYHLWASWSVADEAVAVRPLAALARHVESTPALAFLQPLVDCDLIRWARPRAMRAEVAAALGRVQVRLGREEMERSFVPSA